MNKRTNAKKKKNNAKEIDSIEEDIKKEEARQNIEELNENIKELKRNNFNTGIWKLKNKYFPKDESTIPVAKKNNEGYVITNEAELKKIYLEHFAHRMRDRPIKSDFESYEKEIKYKMKEI